MTEEKLEKVKKFVGTWEFEMQSENIEEVLAAQGNFYHAKLRENENSRFFGLKMTKIIIRMSRMNSMSMEYPKSHPKHDFHGFS